MSYQKGLITGIIGTALVAGAAGGAAWFWVVKPRESAKSLPPPIPATVSKPFKEDQSTTFTITAEAETRLGIRTAPVVRKAMSRKRVYGGEVIIPPGRSVIVSAPLAGTLKLGTAPVAGQAVQAGKPVLHLVPLLDPVGRANLTAARIEADGQVKSTEEQLKAARIALTRAKEVLAGGAGRQRDVDEAQAQVEVATKFVEAATARRDYLAKILGELEAGGGTPILVESPMDGVLRTVTALPGQTVPAGAPLFEVMNLDRVWVRVPVYVGDRDELNLTAPATIGPLVAHAENITRPAWPVVAPPTANPTSGTVDLFFSTSNPDMTDERWRAFVGGAGGFAIAPFVGTPLSPGQRVAVSLTLNEPAESLTVPWSAVVYDFHGGSWLYVKTADRTYTRHRVTIRHITDDIAVLDDGPSPKTVVVTAGAAELFGTETGFSK
ncbi:MAG: HlyD family efflux transporter periplasmic adaptor subunit [Planctomycetia bacterium]|nr:HlyD family efflux transporter periplasmic adaptor subunit [Planctomycetia bacterium]